MTTVVGLTSGEGRNLFHLADLADNGLLDCDVAAVLSDRDAPALDRAEEHGIPNDRVPREDDDPAGHEDRLVDAVEEHGGDLVCLDGYMPILTDRFLDAYPDRVLSVHPSLLPSFNTTDPWRDALDAGVEITGATVHLVADEIGEGPIVAQEAVRVASDDTPESLRGRIHGAERRAYPRAVRTFIGGDVSVEAGRVVADDGAASEGDGADGDAPPGEWLDSATKRRDLRYGENPHQSAAFYADEALDAASVARGRRIAGEKALSFNNVNDADAALTAVREFDEPAAVVVKHTNPCGVATADGVAEAYERALATDEKSAFGGIVALNRRCDAATARQITDSFKEVVVAPEYTDEALDVLREKEKLRVIAVGDLAGDRDPWSVKRVEGGRLVQQRDDRVVSQGDLEIPTEREPTEAELDAMLFGYRVVKHVKSNAIVLARPGETVGVGAGQMSRVDAVELACRKAVKDVAGSVMASDAFFPFRDNVDVAAERGVEAVIQPGGSVNDDEVVEACDEHGVAMAFTGVRCFRH